MGLLEYYNKAKKKIRDTVGSTEKAISFGASTLAQKAESGLKSGARSVRDYFGNDATAGGFAKNTVTGLPSAFGSVASKGPAEALYRSNSRAGRSVALGTALRFPEELGKNLYGGVADFTKTAGGAFGEGLAYGLDKNVRKQYKAGNTDILPTVTRVSPLSMLGKTAKAGLEVWAPKGASKLAAPNTTKAGIVKDIFGRAVKGAVPGYAYDVADRVSADGEINKRTFKPGAGAAIGTLLGVGMRPSAQAAGVAKKQAVAEKNLIVQDFRNFRNPYSKRIVPQTTRAMDGTIPTPKAPGTVSREAVSAVRGGSGANAAGGFSRAPRYTQPAFVDTIKTPFSPQSATGRFLLRPKAGLGIEDVTRSSLAQKNAAIRAKQVALDAENKIKQVQSSIQTNRVSYDDFLKSIGKSDPNTIPTNKNTQAINAMNAEKNAKARSEFDAMMKNRKMTPETPVKPPAVSLPQAVKPMRKMMSIEDFRANGGSLPSKQQLEAEDWMAQEARKVGRELNDSAGAFPGDSEMSSNFEKFKNLFNDPRVRNPKVKELILNGDLETFRREMAARGILSRTDVDNITYSSTGYSGDDVLAGFKEKMEAEFPDLLFGKKVARNLFAKPKTTAIQNTSQSEQDFAKSLDDLPYNKYQQNAYNKKQERIQAIGRVANVDSSGVLRAMGFRKNEIEKLGVKETEKIAALGKLGYSKKDPIMKDVHSEFVTKILEHNVPHKTLQEFYAQKHALDTHYLDGIDPADLKDIFPVSSGWRDMYRNLEVAFGKHFPKIKAQLLDKFDAAKGNYIDDQRNLLGNLDENIVSGLGIKKGSELSGAVQLYGERKVSLEEIKQKFPNDWRKIVQADAWFRDAYTKLLTDLNRVREANFPTHPLYPESTKQIQMRSDYYRHFQELQDGFPALKNILNTSSAIDPALAVSSAYVKPKSKWLSMAQQRTGDTTTVDAVGGFLDYLKAYSYAKNIDPFIQKFRGVDGEIKDFLPYQSKRVGLAEELSQKMDPVQQIAISENPEAIKRILMRHGASDAQSEWMSKELATMSDIEKVKTFLKEKFAKNKEKIFEKMVPSAAANASENKLNNTLKFLDNFANNLAGKSNPIDRPFQDMFLGRIYFKALNWLNSRVKANALLGNAASTVAQVFNVPQGIANAGVRNSTKAIGDTLADIFRSDAPINQSNFLKERFFNDYAHFDTGILNNTKNFAVWMMGVGDEIGSKYIWNAQYRRALAEGVKNPIKWADDETRKLVAGRGVGEVPIAQQAKMTQLIAPFQLEVANQWHIFADWARNDPSKLAMAKKLVIYSVASHLMNAAAKSVRGSDVSFDLLGALMDGIDSYDQEEDKLKGSLKLGGRLAGEIFSNFPGGQTLAAIYPEYGKKIGDTQLPPRKDFFGKGDPTRFGGGILATKALTDPLYSLFPPFGGQQIKKTLGGAQSLSQGYAESGGGKVLTPVDPNAVNIIKGVLFGKNALNEVSRAHDVNQMPLSDQQSEKFKIQGDSSTYFDSVMRDRQANKEKATLKNGGSLSGVPSQLPRGLHLLSNGSIFAPALNKTYKDEASASLAIAKADFNKSDKSFLDLGDKVLRKSANGTITTMRKDDYTSGIYTAKLASAKKSKDWEEWKNTSEKQYQLLRSMMDDSTIDELDKIKIQNKIDTLQSEAKKYASYGGFTKGKSAASVQNKVIALNGAALTHDKRTGDYASWKENAEKQAQTLSAIANDPNRTETQRLQAQNKLDALTAEAKKYAKYGGFRYVKQADSTALELALIRSKFRNGGGSVPKISQMGAPRRFAKTVRRTQRKRFL